MEKRVAIIGAGVSGLLACKHVIEKGFSPIVFEAQEKIGGVWGNTMQSTKLQNPKNSFQFSDFPWPSCVDVLHPSHTQVTEYFESYARHFNLYPYIKFNHEVLSMDYVGVTEEDMKSWDLWGGTGRPFSNHGKWHLQIRDKKHCCLKEFQFEFVILCIGRYSGSPNIPEFPPEKGPKLFDGQIMHSLDYSGMDNDSTTKLIKGKRVVILGSMKSALDIATECANINGVDYPCTIIQRTVHWMVPSNYASNSKLKFLLINQFLELMVHKPGEAFLQNVLATILSPVRWAISKVIETYLKWELPLNKYKMIPKHSFLQQRSSCQTPVLPEKFYAMVEEGSINIKKSQNISFSRKGVLNIDSEVDPLQADLVILATGFKSDDKLKNIFASPTFQRCIKRPNNKKVPLFRHTILPRIPQLAVVGYTESLSNLEASESLSKWLAHFLCGNFDLPCITEMEKDISQWENYMVKYAGKYYWRACIAIPIWFNDQINRDLLN